MDSVETQLSLDTVSRHLIDAVIRDVVCARTEHYSQLEATELAAAQRDQRERDETMVDMTAAEKDDEEQASFALLWYMDSKNYEYLLLVQRAVNAVKFCLW